MEGIESSPRTPSRLRLAQSVPTAQGREMAQEMPHSLSHISFTSLPLPLPLPLYCYCTALLQYLHTAPLLCVRPFIAHLPPSISSLGLSASAARTLPCLGLPCAPSQPTYHTTIPPLFTLHCSSLSHTCPDSHPGQARGILHLGPLSALPACRLTVQRAEGVSRPDLGAWHDLIGAVALPKYQSTQYQLPTTIYW